MEVFGSNFRGCFLLFVTFLFISLCFTSRAKNDLPRLCAEESRLRTVFAQVGDDISFNICIISDDNVTLQNFADRNMKDLNGRYITTIVSRNSGDSKLHDVTIKVFKIQETDFGTMSFLFKTLNKQKGFTYDILFVRKGFAFNTYISLQSVSTYAMYSKSQPLYMMCESSEYPLSSLSIVKKYNKEILNTTVVDGALVHHFGGLQCSDMGTYECLHNNDTSNKATVDVRVFTCPPQPCLHGNKATRIFTALKENVNIDICVMSNANLKISYIFRSGNRTDMLSKNRYESSITKDNLYYNISFLIRDIQEGDYGKLSVNITTDDWGAESLIHEILLEKKDMKFTAAGPSGFKYSVSDNISLVCESSDFAPSDLSISVKGGNGRQQLKTELVKNTLAYTLYDLQCSDMATYICQVANDTCYKTTLDLPILNCAPQLCPEENQTRTQTVDVSRDLNISICVISDDGFFLERIFLDGREDKLLKKNRYKPYNSSEITGEDLYHSVNIEMYNITEEDFGRVTIRLRHVSVVDLHLDYEITLHQTMPIDEGLQEIQQNPANESTRNISATTPLGNSAKSYEPTTASNDSSMIYMISGVCTFVALVLVGNFIYCQIRKRCFRTSSSQIKKESTDHLPVPSQQWTPYGYSVTLYENAAAEQLQEMLQETDDDGYLRPGPIYESIE